jgi:hypothetical protein
MMRRPHLTPVLICLGVLLYGCHWTQTRKPSSTAVPGVGPNVGQLAPDIDGDDTTGEHLQLAEYRGKVVVLHFWANW